MSAQDERKAITQAYAILQTLATGLAQGSDAMSTLRGATRQITTAMARATSGEAATQIRAISAEIERSLGAVTATTTDNIQTSAVNAQSAASLPASPCRA